MNTTPIDDGGAAFPSENDADKEYNYCRAGMSLRDYFAAKALGNSALFSMSGRNEGENDEDWIEWESHCNLLAKNCYVLADAMIAARKEKP
jgi:hypothetical protein